MKRSLLFRSFSLLFCYIIVLSKQKRILTSFGRENKREEYRRQTETSRTYNIDRGKLSDTDQCEPFLVGKIQAVVLQQHKRVIMERKKGKEISINYSNDLSQPGSPCIMVQSISYLSRMLRNYTWTLSLRNINNETARECVQHVFLSL